MAYCLINKSNFFFNLSEVEKKISKSKIAIVLKNNAYGHGIQEMGELANEYNIEHAVVNNISEANRIHPFFKTILVLQDIPPQKISENIIITINSLKSIDSIASGTKVEIKIDTGMHRNGIAIEDIPLALNLILDNKLKLNGVFTHFSSAYLEDSSLASQKAIFDKIRLDVINDSRFNHDIRFHCCASSSLLRVDNSDYDLVRIGIMSYGYISLPESYKKPTLKPVLSLWGEKITSKSISKGDSVGYGQAYTAKDSLMVSTYDIGYGDGFMRLNEDKRTTIEDGREILGIVSMNSFSTTGDDKEVCIFENAEKFANVHGTIIYEIISNINPSLKRVIV